MLQLMFWLAGLHAIQQGWDRHFQANTIRTRNVLSTVLLGIKVMRRPDYPICPQELLAAGGLLLKQLHQYSYALGDLWGDPSELSIAQMAKWLNPMINGWINYYGQYYRSALYGMCRHVNKALVRWARRKFKPLRRHKTKALKFLERISEQNPRLFAHWRQGMVGPFAWWERYELRGSRTVLREAAGEVPAVYSP